MYLDGVVVGEMRRAFVHVGVGLVEIKLAQTDAFVDLLPDARRDLLPIEGNSFSRKPQRCSFAHFVETVRRSDEHLRRNAAARQTGAAKFSTLDLRAAQALLLRRFEHNVRSACADDDHIIVFHGCSPLVRFLSLYKIRRKKKSRPRR